MPKNTFTIPQEERDSFHKAMEEERAEQDARLEKLIESERTNIPSNEEIIKMIPSKAVREYLLKIGHQFSERDRYLLWLYLDPSKKEISDELWEKGRYVSLPHPFRRGDIVACYGYCPVLTNPREHKGEYVMGIMRSFANDEDWAAWDNDVKTRLKSFTELEFARDIEGALIEDSPKTDYLEVASDLMKGEGSIELLQMYCKKYKKSEEAIK